MFELVDLGVRNRFEDDLGSVRTAKTPEFVLEMLLGLRGDVPNPLFTLEFGDEITSDGHPSTIAGIGRLHCSRKNCV
jgi:hypothetical protein